MEHGIESIRERNLRLGISFIDFYTIVKGIKQEHCYVRQSAPLFLRDQISIQQLGKSQKEVTKSDYKIWTKDILSDQHIYIKNRQKLEKVAILNILYLEADGHYCQVHTMEKKYLVRLSMNDLSKRLPTELFFQSHRSFLVNMRKIQSVDLQDSIVILAKDPAISHVR